jgi:hypothetical protein
MKKEMKHSVMSEVKGCSCEVIMFGAFCKLLVKKGGICLKSLENE